jgi:hypothetical protein
MKKSAKVGFSGKMLFSVTLAGLALLALMVSFPIPASAAGDSSGDAKIQSMRTDIEACMQSGNAGKKAREAFAKKYNVSVSKVNEKFGGKQSASNGTNWEAVCFLEVWCTGGVGSAVWQGRRDQDGCDVGMPVDGYCKVYSENFEHYNWKKGLMNNEKFPQCYHKK